MADEKKIQKLIQDLGSEYLGVRLCACDGLTKIGEPAAVPAFINALKDENKLVRSRSAEALGKIGDKRAVLPLISALKDEDQYVRKRVTWALNEIAGSMVNKEDYVSALKIIKDSTVAIMRFYHGKKDHESLKERKEILGKFTGFAEKIHDKMNPDKKKFPVKRQEVKLVKGKRLVKGR